MNSIRIVLGIIYLETAIKCFPNSELRNKLQFFISEELKELSSKYNKS